MALAYFDTVLGFVSVMLALSLLVTIAVQLLEAAINLRGDSLKWGLTQIAERTCPTLKQHAGLLVDRVLRHPALCRHLGPWQRLGVAVRREEFVMVLRDVAASDADPAIKELAGDLAQGMDSAAKEAELWFNTVMDRTTERFTGRTRVLAAGVAVVLALGLHIDTPHIFRQLYSKPDARNALIQSALTESKAAFHALQENQPIARVALLKVLDGKGVKLTEVASAGLIRVESRKDAMTELEAIGKSEGLPPDELKSAYVKAADAAATQRIVELEKLYGGINDRLSSSGIELSPKWASDCSWIPFKCAPGGGSPALHLLGMLFSAAFLALGAPFWFNLLRNMASLRPLIAGKVATS